jgi:hypothetical protein
MQIRIVRRAPSLTYGQSIVVIPPRVRVEHRLQRVLDFDCEARPLHWISNDYVSKEITAMAWAWTDKPKDVTCYLLGETTHREMLAAFVEAYNQADMVTGHYITGYDLPLVNAMLMENQMATLGDKLAQDTKTDLVRRGGISASQENMAAMLCLAHDKVKMNQAKWWAANRLQPEGLQLARERVVGDIQQHMEMRAKLLELGYLCAPKKWSGGAAPAESYTP